LTPNHTLIKHLGGMVVAQIVRICNTTDQTFRLQAGDPFYTPSVAGEPWPDGGMLVPPGFDESLENLVIPWCGVTGGGLVITEEDKPEDLFRCVIGPMDEDPNGRDWLRFHDSSWAPIHGERWLPVGDRHFLGTVGSTAELQLTFRDARHDFSADLKSLLELTHFDKATSCAPPNAVLINIFDLAPQLTFTNDMLCNSMMKSLGAFHAAVEVYGEEWSFYRTPNPEACGVCRSLRPRHHPVHLYRQSILAGTTPLKEWEVRFLIRSKLAPVWRGGNYHILRRNCIHFCDELLLMLGVGPMPSWVCHLHNFGAGVANLFYPITYLLGADSTPSDREEAAGPLTKAGKELPLADEGEDEDAELTEKPAKSCSTSAMTGVEAGGAH